MNHVKETSRVCPQRREPQEQSWTGVTTCRPDECYTTVVIPHHGPATGLWLAVELFKMAEPRCHIQIIDTGSSLTDLTSVQRFEHDHVEVHSIRAHGYSHPSEPVTAALDLALTLCQTPTMLCTHNDVFLRRRTAIDEHAQQITTETPIIGYSIEPRDAALEETHYALGHTWLMLDVETLHRHGITWSLRRSFQNKRFEKQRPGWPDTETGFNRLLLARDVTCRILEPETHDHIFSTAHFDHIRHSSSHHLYGAEWTPKENEDRERYTFAAIKRLLAWKQQAAERGDPNSFDQTSSCCEQKK